MGGEVCSNTNRPAVGNTRKTAEGKVEERAEVIQAVRIREKVKAQTKKPLSKIPDIEGSYMPEGME